MTVKEVFTAQQLDTMVQQIDFTHVTDWFSSYILKDHPVKEQLRIQWLKSKNKWALRAGWSLMAVRSPEMPMAWI